MQANVLGVQEVDFVTEDGVHIQGKNIYVSFKNRMVDGLKTNKFFISSSFKDIYDLIVPDVSLDVDFNEKGRIENIDIV